MVMCAAFSSCFIASVAAAEQHRRQLQSAGFTATLNDYQGITVESKQWQMLGLSVQQDMAPCAVTHDGALLVAAGNFGRSTSLYLSTHSAEDGTLVMEQAWTFAGSDSARALAISSDDVLAYVISRSTTDAGHAARAGVSKVHLHDDQVAPVTTVWSADPATDVLAEGVALWNDEALYIGGRTDGALSSFTNQGGSDFVLGRLRASDLTLSWELQWGTAAADLLSGVAVTQDGTHLFVSGHTSGQLPGCDAYGGSDFVLFKFTTAVPPALVWQKQWGTAANEIASLHMSAAITSDSASVVVTGNSGSSLATTKFSAALGAQLWFQLSSYSGVSDFARSMTLASDDMHGYLCGETSGTVAGFGTVPGGPTRFAVSKFSMASGTILWKQSWGTTSNDFGRGCTSGLDPNVLFLTGYRLVTHAAATKITAGECVCCTAFACPCALTASASVPPVVANPVPIAAATAGETLSITVPVGTCTDANRNNSTIQVAGYVALTSGGSAGGDVGIGVTPGVQGAAMVSGTCTLVGDASLTVYLTCTNDLGASVQHSFDIVVTDEPPVVFNPIPSQTAVAGQPFSLVVPVDTFLDTITATANLTITGTVSIVAGGISGGSIGIAVTGGAPGTAEVSGTCTLVGDAMLEVALTCVDEAGASVVHSFSIEVSGAHLSAP